MTSTSTVCKTFFNQCNTFNPLKIIKAIAAYQILTTLRATGGQVRGRRPKRHFSQDLVFTVNGALCLCNNLFVCVCVVTMRA